MSDLKGHLVVVDDDIEMRSLTEDFLMNEGYKVHSFGLAQDALNFLNQPESQYIECIVSDIRMPQMDGLQFAEKVKALKPDIPVVLMTAFGSIESAIDAIRKGVFDYITKPYKLAEMSVTVDRAVHFFRIKNENQILRTEIKKTHTLGELIGKSSGMKNVFDLVQRVANAQANVLITGESGTGKEMVARAIHQNGSRSQGPFIAINCTAIPETLLESELFGHAKGSFTGAVGRKIGLFEEANGGTLFLDEIGDMDVGLQAKLLRVLQEKKIKAVGDNQTRDIDVRIIAATHKDLKEAIRQGNFREDLYYRLSVIPVVIPPLRHRKEDIPLLAEYFLKKYAAQNNVPMKGFAQSAMQKLVNLRWEGNVRELENMIERMVVLATHSQIQEKDIPNAENADAENFYGDATSDFPTIENLEKRYIQLILEKTAGRKEKAAQILGINRRTLYRKEREYGLTHIDESMETEDDAKQLLE